jgi:probable addiction module antidote protein
MNAISEQISDTEREEALETIQVVLNARPDATTLPLALRYLASVRDMAWLARATGMNRTALFRSLRADGNPKLKTLSAILRVFGLRLSVVQIDQPIARPPTPLNPLREPEARSRSP